MTKIKSDFPTTLDANDVEVCRACGRPAPHRLEHVGYHDGAVRCIALPLEGHHPGPGFVRGKVRAFHDGSWSDEWIREEQVTGTAVQYVGGWLFERSDGAHVLWDDVRPDTRAAARAARLGVTT